MRVRRAIAAAVGGLLLLSGCALFEDPEGSSEQSSESDEGAEGSGDSEDSEETPEEPIEYDPAVMPERFDSGRATTFEETNVYDAVVVEDRVVTMTLDRVRARSLPDLASSWELSPDGLFVDLEASGKDLYALDVRVNAGAGTSVGSQTVTVRRLSANTGAVLGEATWDAPRDIAAPGEPNARLVSAAGNSVVIESTGSNADGRRTTVGLDLDAGKHLWTQRPGTFVGADNNTVVVDTSMADESGALMGVDRRTGDERWTAFEELEEASLVGFHRGSVTVVTVTGDPEATPQISAVDLADGAVQEIGTTDDATWACHPASPGWAVCGLPRENALGFNLSRQEIAWEVPTADRFGVGVTTVRGDHVYGFTPNGSPVVLHAETGEDLEDSPGAAANSVNGYGGVLLYGGQAVFYPALPD